MARWHWQEFYLNAWPSSGRVYQVVQSITIPVGQSFQRIILGGGVYFASTIDGGAVGTPIAAYGSLELRITQTRDDGTINDVVRRVTVLEPNMQSTVAIPSVTRQTTWQADWSLFEFSAQVRDKNTTGRASLFANLRIAFTDRPIIPNSTPGGGLHIKVLSSDNG